MITDYCLCLHRRRGDEKNCINYFLSLSLSRPNKNSIRSDRANSGKHRCLSENTILLSGSLGGFLSFISVSLVAVPNSLICGPIIVACVVHELILALPPTTACCRLCFYALSCFRIPYSLSSRPPQGRGRRRRTGRSQS